MDKKAKTIKTYSDMAETLREGYDEYFEKVVLPEAEEFLSLVPTGGLILDAGCGAGTHSRFFMERGYDVKAIDLSPGMVRQCKKQGIDAHEMDLEDIRLDQSFDGVWCHTSLIHLDSKARIGPVLKKFYSLLKPKSPLFIALREGSGETWELYHEEQGTERWFLYFRQGELESYVPQGFTITSVRRNGFKTKSFLNYLLRKG